MPGMLRVRYYVLGAAVVWTLALAAFVGYEILFESGRADSAREHLLLELGVCAILWCAGLIGLFVAGKRLRSGLEQRNAERRRSEDRLRHAEDELRLDHLRMQIAADLHDDIGSTLSSTAIFNSMLQKSLTQHTPELADLSIRIEDNLRHIQESLHDIVWSVNPANDTLDNTLLRIQEYAADVMEAQGITVTIRRPPLDGDLAIPMQRRRPLFLLMKEAITNTVRHACCTQVLLGINVDAGRLSITLQDNGQGFDPGRVRGNGLQNMKQRAQDLGAEFTLTSAPGKGTTIMLVVSLQ
jgi:signal transduction histidine kinase